MGLFSSQQGNYTVIEPGELAFISSPPSQTRRRIFIIGLTCFCILSLIGLLILDPSGYLSDVFTSPPLRNLTNDSPVLETQVLLKFVSLGTNPSTETTKEPNRISLIKNDDIEEAFAKALKDLKVLDEINDALIHQKISLTKGCPAHYHHMLSETKHSSTRNLTRTALLLEKATKYLKDKFLLGADQIVVDLPRIDLGKHKIKPPRVKCNSRNKYRTMDGSCNNEKYSVWGKANTVFTRLLPSNYADGVAEARISNQGSPLPSAREVSTNIHTYSVDPDHNASHLMMAWGHLLAHDITKSSMIKAAEGQDITCCHDAVRQNPSLMHPECLPIDIPSTDPFYSSLKQTCMEYVRSNPGPRNSNSLGPREQLNFITAFIDGSNIYGSSDEEMKNLRTFQHGTLKVHKANHLEMLPFNASDPCSRSSENKLCYQAGNSRVNLDIILTSMQTVLLREHNRIVKQLTEINPQWDDEKLFQEGRKIVGAIIQHITFNEFLPPLLGSQVIKAFGLQLLKTGYYDKYDPYTNPSISNVFATAAYRFGHSMVQGLLELRSFREIEVKQLHKFLLNPFNLEKEGYLDKILKGAMHQPAKHPDQLFTAQLTNHLFQGPSSSYGLDLAAVNIQRGRDHGIPSYNKWRKFCGLKTFKNFMELNEIMDPNVAAAFEVLYKSVDDIDLYPAGLSEKPVEDSMLGPTFSCLLAEQFFRLRRGDRFWYERDGQPHSFTPAQLQSIRQSSLARILCDNTGITHVIQKSMLQKSASNLRVSCRSKQVPLVDLTQWYEDFNS